MDDPATDPMALLAEWYQWWDTSAFAPAKMPNALHVRTAMALLLAGLLDENARVADPSGR